MKNITILHHLDYLIRFIIAYNRTYLKHKIPDAGITFIRYAQSRKIAKPNNIKVFGSKKTKMPKQDSQCSIRSHTSMSEGE